MAREAKKLKQGSDWDGSAQKANRDKRAAGKTRKTAFGGMVFEDLSDAQKDKLLKAVAIQLRLIEESPDS